MSQDEQTQSLWMEVKLPTFPTLNENLYTDVCIVGAGISGLTCAYTLLQQGKSVVILDQNLGENSQTMRTTAHLSWALDDRYFDIEKLFGEEGSALAAESHSKAINFIEEIVLKEKIDCHFERVNGYLFAVDQEEVKTLDKEFTAITKIGKEIHKLDQVPFNSASKAMPCLQFPKQAQFHIGKYMQGLLEAVVRLGGRVYDQTHVNQIEENAVVIVKTDSGCAVEAHSVIVATCTPINDRVYIHTKQSAYRTYVIAASVPKGSIPKGLYWDTLDPYHYIRLEVDLNHPDLEWLIIGGEDHKTGQDADIEERYQNLEKWAHVYFPKVENFTYHWSGQVYEPIDSLAFIGRNPGNKNIYIVTGDSGNGMTHGTIAGLLLPDLILGAKNPWESLYDPSRKTIAAVSEFMEENLNVLMQYKDWLTPGDVQTITNLEVDEGVILRRGLKKIAVFKDKEGKLFFNSAFCPHLGGCVRWNSGEKSWDCPCHGSRFDAKGKVIVGPAVSDLSPCEVPD